MVMVMWCSLNMVMMVHWLCWASLGEGRLPPIDWSRRTLNVYIFVLLIMMVMMVMMMAIQLAHNLQLGNENLLMMRRMVVVVLVSFGTANAGRRPPPIGTIDIEDALLILDALWFPPLLRVYSLKPQHVSRFWVMRERALSILWHRASTRWC